MALTNRLGVVNWTLENDVITLQSSLLNQKRLEDETGMGFFEFVSKLDDDKGNPLMRMAELFHFLQVGTEYTPAEIYACFFADLNAYGDDFSVLQTKLINHMLGQKETAVIAAAPKEQEKKAKA